MLIVAFAALLVAMKKVSRRYRLQVCHEKKRWSIQLSLSLGGNNAPSRVTDVDAPQWIMLYPDEKVLKAYLNSGYVFWSNTHIHTRWSTPYREQRLYKSTVVALNASRPVRDNPIKASALEIRRAVEIGASLITILEPIGSVESEAI